MRHRNRRLVMIAVSAVVLMVAVSLGVVATRDAFAYFYSPSDVVADHPDRGERIRLGGLVLEGSIQDQSDGSVIFTITDRVEQVSVRYEGFLPDLFSEGQGVVTEGRFGDDDVFQAQTVLAKHDETYMPPEVAEALREAGVWQGEEDQPE